MYSHRGNCNRRHTCCCGKLKIQYVFLLFILLEIALFTYLGYRITSAVTYDDSEIADKETTTPNSTDASASTAAASTSSGRNAFATKATMVLLLIVALPSLFTMMAYVLALCGMCFKRAWTVVPLMMLKAMLLLMFLYFAIAVSLLHLLTTNTLVNVTENLDQKNIMLTSGTDTASGRRAPVRRISYAASAKVLRQIIDLMKEFYIDTMLFVAPVLLFAVIIFTLALRTYRYYGERRHYGDCDETMVEHVEMKQV